MHSFEQAFAFVGRNEVFDDRLEEFRSLLNLALFSFEFFARGSMLFGGVELLLCELLQLLREFIALRSLVVHFVLDRRVRLMDGLPFCFALLQLLLNFEMPTIGFGDLPSRSVRKVNRYGMELF